jgi:MFS family permease
VIAGLFVVGAGLSTIIPIAFSSAGHNQSLPNGIGLAMVTTLGYFGFLFGPPIIGFLADAQGLRFALSFVMILFVLMLFMSTKIEE